jgi:SagB-type dehydrogenase family enzyme
MRPDSNEAVARVHAYHHASKHHLDRYAPGPRDLDWANQPDPFRCFPGAEVIELPLLADNLDTDFNALHAPGRVVPLPRDLEHLAVLLELSMGLSAWKRYGANTWSLRCNPSSGNLHPTEAYVVCPMMAGLDAGVYHYLSLEHRLEHRAAVNDPGWSGEFGSAGTIVGLSSIYWREAWKYGMRAWRYCQHDVGHAVAAMRYAAAALGWQCRIMDSWSDQQIAGLLGLDRELEFPPEDAEVPDVVLWLGIDSEQPDAETLLQALEEAEWHGQANRLSPDHVRWDDIDIVHSATAKSETEALPRPTEMDLPPLSEGSMSQKAATLFRQRRSAVSFDGATPMSAGGFFRMLDELLPRPGVAPWDALPWQPRIHPALFVHRVNGVQPGLYLLLRDASVEPRLRCSMRPEWLWEPVANCPDHLLLRLLLPTDLRDAARIISCHQDIAADSAFSLAMLADFDESVAHSPWCYRNLFWEAGVLGQVLYLEAEAAGMRGTGIGCFFDDEMHRLLGLQDSRWQDLYHFTVGGPVEDTRLMTLPPYAHLAQRQ